MTEGRARCYSMRKCTVGGDSGGFARRIGGGERKWTINWRGGPRRMACGSQPSECGVDNGQGWLNLDEKKLGGRRGALLFKSSGGT